ncbi:MAG: hypothetical protein GY696_27930, partial [Gammaproteobacteria bacterium]|nr:hypothetical protein [Gammaproteobacteria bacterium]
MDRTQFIKRKEIFRMKRKGFGLCKALATFQRMMDVLFASLFPDRVWVYLDDMTELFKGDPKYIVWAPACQTFFLQLEQAFLEAS